MLGVGINVATVLLGGALGLLLGGRVAQRLRDTVMQGLGLCVLVIGALSALETADVLALIVGIGLNMLGVAKIRVGNLLPAVFVPLVYVPLAAWLGGLA